MLRAVKTTERFWAKLSPRPFEAGVSAFRFRLSDPDWAPAEDPGAIAKDIRDEGIKAVK
jgi:hypothetical protein